MVHTGGAAGRRGERTARAARRDEECGEASSGELETRSRAIEALSAAGVPFLVAGAYAFFAYTGIFRDTKDLDVMLLERSLPTAFSVLEAVGFETELLDPGWIAKAYAGDSFIDLIFSSSNGLAVVDERWFQHARPATILGHACLIAPVEEIIFTKAFVDERERYDGADVNHLIYACGGEMDWERLLERFGAHWEVLFSHLTLYRFVYPGARGRVPDWLVNDLCQRMLAQLGAGDAEGRLCRGHLISTRQYRHDYEKLGLEALPAAGANGGRARGGERRGGASRAQLVAVRGGDAGTVRRRLRKSAS
jgi:hypothetical protein